jgi:hypothetical protein
MVLKVWKISLIELFYFITFSYRLGNEPAVINIQLEVTYVYIERQNPSPPAVLR